MQSKEKTDNAVTYTESSCSINYTPEAHHRMMGSCSINISLLYGCASDKCNGGGE